MKKIMLCFVLWLSVLVGAHAQDVLYVYQNNGLIEAFNKAEIEKICYSNIDTLGIEHDDYQVQEIWTPDSVYRFALEDIDSVALHTPSTIYKEDAKILSGEFLDYVIKNTGDTLWVTKSIPQNLIPAVGTKIAIEECSDKLPRGFMGKVRELNTVADTLLICCDSLRVTDIYERLYYTFDTKSYSFANAPRKIFLDPDITLNKNVKIDLTSLLRPSFTEDKEKYAWSVSPDMSLSVSPDLRMKGLFIVNEGIENYANFSITGMLGVHAHYSLSGSIGVSKDFNILPLTFDGFYPLEIYLNIGAYAEMSMSGTVDMSYDGKYRIGFQKSWVPFGGHKVLPDRSFCIPLEGSGITDDSKVSIDGNVRAGIFYEFGVDIGNNNFDKLDVRFNEGYEVNLGLALTKDDIVNAGKKTSTYKLLREQKLTGNVYAELLGELKFLDNTMFSVKPFETKPDILSFETALVPEFSNTKFEQTDDKSTSPKATTTVSGSCFVPCYVGMSVLDSKEQEFDSDYNTFYYKDYTATDYSKDFKDCKFGETYTCYPTVTLFGMKMLAEPSAECEIAPEVSTLSASDVYIDYATCNGRIPDYDGTQQDTSYGITYSEDPNSGWKNISASNISNGDFSVYIEGLKENTTYYYMAFMKVGDKTYYGEKKTFKTLPVPKAITGSASNVTKNSAYVECSFKDVQTDMGAECGVMLVNNGNHYRMSTKDGNFPYTFSGLSPKTTYSYKAYVLQKEKYYYGDVMTFTTLKEDEDPDDPDDPDHPSMDVLSPYEQKLKLDSIAQNLMDAMPASDFDELGKLASYVRDNYGENYDWDAVGDWQLACYKALRKHTGTDKNPEYSYWTDSDGILWTNVYTEIIDNYTALLYASNFTSHFTAKDGKWVRSNADDLEFIFKDADGQECVLKLATSGECAKVHLCDPEYWTDWECIEEGTTSYVNDYYDKASLTIGVPEKLEVSLTEGAKTMLKVTVNFNLSEITSTNNFDLSKSSLSCDALVEFYNGYKVDISKIKYTANTDALVSMVLSKNDQSLITAYVSSNVSGLPSSNVSDIIDCVYDQDNPFETGKIDGNGVFTIDVMGELQVDGVFSNVGKAIEALEDCDDASHNGEQFSADIAKLNSCYDAYLYYNKTDTKQASLSFETFGDEGWDGEIEYIAEPVFNFFDGSSYSTFSAFFNDNDFRRLINSFKAFANSYSAYVGESIYGDEDDDDYNDK